MTNYIAAAILLAGFFGACVLIMWPSKREEKPEQEEQPDLSIVVMGEDGVTELSSPSEFLQYLLIQTNDTLRGMGCESLYDYAEDTPEFEDRISRCYELAAKAVLSPNQPAPHMPPPVAVLQGRWCGPRSKSCINHAIVLLADGRVWEPITMAICNPHQFGGYTRFLSHRVFSPARVRQQIMRTQHWGPWEL